MKPLLKKALAIPMATFLEVTRRTFGHQDSYYQSVILHDVPHDQIPSLITFLNFIHSEYGFISPEDALSGVRPAKTPDGRLPCLITIDDGFKSSHTIGCEILPRYGARAIFFICPGLVDSLPDIQTDLVQRNVFGGMPPPKVPSLMTWQEIHDVNRAGHVIGAHGFLHERLSTLRGPALEEEVVNAKARLQYQLGIEPLWYAYAFGDVESLSAQAAQVIARNFRYCRSGVRGQNRLGHDGGILFAQEIDLAMPTNYHRAILRGALDWRYASARARLRTYVDTATPS